MWNTMKLYFKQNRTRKKGTESCWMLSGEQNRTGKYQVESKCDVVKLVKSTSCVGK